MSIPFKKNKGKIICEYLKPVLESLAILCNEEEVSDVFTSMFFDMHMKNIEEKEMSITIDNRNILLKLALRKPMACFIHSNILPCGSKTNLEYISMELVMPNGEFDYDKSKKSILYEIIRWKNILKNE